MDDAVLQFDPLNITDTLIFKIGSLLIPAAWTSVFISVYLLKNRINHFYINSNMTKLSFSCIEINKPLSAPVQCHVHQIQLQQPALVVATHQMPDHT